MPELTNAERLKQALEKPKQARESAQDAELLHAHMLHIQNVLKPHGLSIATLLASVAAKFHGIHIKLPDLHELD